MVSGSMHRARTRLFTSRPLYDIPDPIYLEIRKPRYEKVAEMYNATVIAGDQDKQKMLDEVMAAIDEVLPSLQE